MELKCTNKLPHISNNYFYDILIERGITNPDEYLNVDESAITPFEGLDNITKAADTLLDVLNKEQPHILITVDSDVDGYTSAAIMYGYIKKIANKFTKIDYLIHEGKQHGIDDLISQIEDIQPDILIIPDASSSELEEH